MAQLIPFQEAIHLTTAQMKPDCPNGHEQARIKEQYGEQDPWQITILWRVEQERALCDGCRGHCLKSHNRYVVPREIKTRWGWQRSYLACRFALSRMTNVACRHAHIPPKFLPKSFEDYQTGADNERAVHLARAYIAKKPRQGLYLYGQCGSGKTFLASLIGKAFVAEYMTVHFVDVPTLLQELKGRFGNDTESTQEYLERLARCDLLILDDLGAGKKSEWSLSVLYQVINDRYNAERSTLVTSNYSLKELAEHMKVKEDEYTGKRIASRLSEMCVSANLGDKDRRL